MNRKAKKTSNFKVPVYTVNWKAKNLKSIYCKMQKQAKTSKVYNAVECRNLYEPRKYIYCKMQKQESQKYLNMFNWRTENL